jgi:hypothetical protein
MERSKDGEKPESVLHTKCTSKRGRADEELWTTSRITRSMAELIFDDATVATFQSDGLPELRLWARSFGLCFLAFLRIVLTVRDRRSKFSSILYIYIYMY